ncbi:MAG: alpha/beta hydrolase [Alphaproteobacteria bacterium]|nr:alpha/beta hydrolase [Alphaproteobacteria bacterium]
MSFLSKSVAVATGVTLTYAEKGDPSGVPVIFIHGITDSHLSYGPVLDVLPSGFHAFAVTMRGHGASSKPAGHYAPEDMAADVVAFLDAQKIERAIVVGHSMGSLVARCVAEAHPERVLGLVIVGAFASLHANPAVEELRKIVDALGDDIPYEFAREFQMSTLATPVPAAFLAMAIAETQKVPARVFRSATAGLMVRDHASTGAAYAGPTLIVWGDQDAFCPRADQDALVRAFKNAELLIYDGIGHAVHWEEPVRFALDFAAWAKRIDGGSVRAA